MLLLIKLLVAYSTKVLLLNNVFELYEKFRILVRNIRCNDNIGELTPEVDLILKPFLDSAVTSDLRSFSDSCSVVKNTVGEVQPISNAIIAKNISHFITLLPCINAIRTHSFMFNGYFSFPNPQLLRQKSARRNFFFENRQLSPRTEFLFQPNKRFRRLT